MSNDITLNFNQLLDAVKIELLQQQIVQNQKQYQLFSKLGDSYQDRLLSPKMRLLPIDNNTNNSAGSSRRSTPTDSISSNCSSSNSSSPNSPPSLLQIQTQRSAFVNTNNLPNQFSFDLLVNNHPVLNTLNVTPNILEQQVYKKPAIVAETSSEIINAATPNTQTLDSSSSLQSFLNYSSTLHHNLPSSSAVSLSIRQSRAAHNELEKNRRANLRGYLDKLKTVLPPEPDSTRDTTLSLLTRARNYLRTVKHDKNALLEKRKNVFAELLHLRHELASLKETEKNIVVSSNSLSPIVTIENNEKNQTMEVENNCSKSFAFSVSSSMQLCKKKGISTKNINSINYMDLYMEGLLPAFPLLYPYQKMTIHHSPLIKN